MSISVFNSNSSDNSSRVKSLEYMCYQKLREGYLSSLDKMKSAQLIAFFRMKEQMRPSADGIPMTIAFKSFNPCPLRLMVIELCTKSLNLQRFPEIFEGFEGEFIEIHQAYQILPDHVKAKLVEELSEGEFSWKRDFNLKVEAFVLKIEESSNASKIPFLLDVFHQEVHAAKELIDLISKIARIENENENPERPFPSTDALIMRPLFTYLKSGNWDGARFSIFNGIFPKLAEIKETYDEVGLFSKLYLDRELMDGRFYNQHFDQKAEKVLVECEQVVSEIKEKNRNIIPLIVFLAKKQAGCFVPTYVPDRLFFP